MENLEKNEIMFIQLVSMFQAAALQQMGKMKNPVTDKIEKNLEQAQLSIDLLDMLKEKTKGNRSADEERFLSSVIQDLKLNYVDELAKETPSPAEKSEASK
ncbi:MAG TPA: DUF1844 domain-containing protein [Bacteroidota bacterium]|nr:DUF1844 domain-containing protein [Bacteroidota bacterium]